MKTRVPVIAVVAVAMLGLAGCSPSSAPPAAEETAEETPAEEEPAEEEPAGDAVVAIASTDLGDVVVDAEGMTLYMFDNDTQSGDTSSCTGQCLEQWPPLFTESDAPTGSADITGELGTIESPDGKLQVTLNGWPLYYWVNDKAAGETTGQAVGGVWWVLDPAGEPIRDE